MAGPDVYALPDDLPVPATSGDRLSLRDLGDGNAAEVLAWLSE